MTPQLLTAAQLAPPGQALDGAGVHRAGVAADAEGAAPRRPASSGHRASASIARRAFVFVSVPPVDHDDDADPIRSGPDALPSVFSSIDLRSVYDRSSSFSSPRFTASYGADLMHITDKSDLNLRFSYYRDKGKVVWDIDGIVIGDDKSNNISYSVFRYAMPPKDLPDSFQSNWKNVEGQKFPYNRSAYYKEAYTVINSAQRIGPSLYYIESYSANGKAEQEQMEKKLDGFLRNLKVHEKADALVKASN